MSFIAARAAVTPNFTVGRRGASASLKAMILEWRKRIRGRRELAGMPDRDRHDLGYSNCDVDAETRKPFWTP